ncbi:GlxA family transcriptional regulator [Nocardioides nitrophenolicus]|uniref:GlxA family transcriptional regulator n=1 Tax=Nocardioides nitrophenolicus TaxID=60489 RepID=UPI00195CA914|nr:helix-turn-helix domain-containing protein [Nocardioides nitrophenolicus]MBM7515501.1 transcriptional regulator GlxA family with amidase domain [Nocardioides nitrophenolicus]
MPSPRPHRIGVVALPGVYAYELGVASRFFGAAEVDGRPAYEVVTCSLDGRPVPTSADFSVAVRADRSVLAEVDTIVVPPWDTAPDGGDPIGLADHTAQRVVSYCTGAFTVASSGRLDGRAATTHWRMAEHFRVAFPRIDFRPDALFVDEDDVLTAAGASAAVDLTLHIIAKDLGAAVAADVSRATLAPPHRGGGQSQFVARPVVAEGPGTTADVRAWLLDRLDRPVSLDEVAAAFGVSVRTLTRRFRDETGLTLGNWLVQARVERAKELLETSDAVVDLVAERAGFATAAALRKHFRDRVGLSPQQYRARFSLRASV